MPNKAVTKKVTKEVKPVSKASGLSISLFGIDGKKKGTISLSKEMFGAKINESLMLQALRVYLVNQRQGTANTKTRSEVRGSTRKIYRQKGTGRARHGGITAPIFVGGGVAMGPKTRSFELKMPRQMRKKALFSALSQKLKEEKIMAVDSAALSGKTKEANKMFKVLSTFKKNNPYKVLFVTGEKNATNASRNIAGVTVVPPHTVNIYEVVNNNFLILGKDAVEKMEGAFVATKE